MTICYKISLVAFLLIAHTKKLGRDSLESAGDPEIMRGASAVKDGTRCTLTLTRLTKLAASKLNIDWDDAKNLIRLDDAKMNFAATSGEAEWYQMISVKLPNSDSVGVPVAVDIDSLAQAEDTDYSTMTGTGFAELIETCGGNDVISASSFLFKDIKPRLKQAAGVSTTTVAEWPALLSRDAKRPTRIRSNGKYVDYTASKDGSGSRAPWRIFRQELN